MIEIFRYLFSYGKLWLSIFALKIIVIYFRIENYRYLFSMIHIFESIKLLTFPSISYLKYSFLVVTSDIQVKKLTKRDISYFFRMPSIH